jgi:transcriptional regulator of acetoin/glycerol metabolism
MCWPADMKHTASASHASSHERSLAVRPDAMREPNHSASITRSHERCLALGVEPDRTPDLSSVTPHRLRETRQKHRRLCDQATPVMEMLYEQIVSTHSMVVLADRNGTILQAIGDNGFLERAEQVALAPGVNWAESSKGTNAIGTALFDESATLVHGSEHYVNANHFLTCSAAPIFDHNGDVLGVLDVTGDQRSYHPHTLGLVGLSARMIEHQWINDKFRQGLRLCFHRRAELLGTMREAMLALSPEGAILGANRGAIELLGLNVAALRMLGLEAVFGIGVAQIADYFRRATDEPMQLRPQHGSACDTLLYADAQFNWPTRWPAVSAPAPAAAPAADSAPASTLEAQEIAAVRQALDASGGNVSLAARRLGVARNTVYRKLRGSG